MKNKYRIWVEGVDREIARKTELLKLFESDTFEDFYEESYLDLKNGKGNYEEFDKNARLHGEALGKIIISKDDIAYLKSLREIIVGEE